MRIQHPQGSGVALVGGKDFAQLNGRFRRHTNAVQAEVLQTHPVHALRKRSDAVIAQAEIWARGQASVRGKGAALKKDLGFPSYASFPFILTRTGPGPGGGCSGGGCGQTIDRAGASACRRPAAPSG